MATTLTTGIVLPDSNDNVSRIAYRNNLQVISDKLVEGENVLGAHLADYTYQVAGGTATAITLTINNLTDGYPMTFIASANNNGNATTINSKPLYKPDTTNAPMLIAGKAYTVWYSQSGDCFFIKASAEGNATVDKVLAGYTFSNDSDTGLDGTMPNRGTFNLGLGVTVPAGYYSGGTTADGKRFAHLSDNTANGVYSLNISNLGFTPTKVIAFATAVGGGQQGQTYAFILSNTADLDVMSSYHSRILIQFYPSLTSSTYDTDTDSYIQSNGFYLQFWYVNSTGYWRYNVWAYE